MPGGRPTLYSRELGEEICKLIASGKSLREVCLMDGMPARSTVKNWKHEHPEFMASITCAREDCADWHADQALAVTQSAMGGGKYDAGAAREIARIHMMLARVMDPARYSESAKLAVEHSGQVGQIMQVNVNVVAAQTRPRAIDVEPVKPALASNNAE